MIYNNSTPIMLYGEDADNFLESYGIELYEDSIAIGESMFDGHDGECLLNENGIFLYEDHIVLEGEQAEAYKARKAKEKEDSQKKENERNIRRYNNSVDIEIGCYKSPGDTGNKDEDRIRRAAVDNLVGKERDRRRQQHNDARKDYINQDNKYIDIANDHPGNRPKGLFKRAEKAEYDKKYANYKDKLSAQEVRRDDAYERSKSTARAYDRSTKNEIKDATNRHIRRHPKQYKEGTIFESVEFI